ncbi:MAG: SRPBCC family protein [Acidobacteriota bacterium]
MRQIEPITTRKRVHLHETMHIQAEPSIIFPLLCPVREYDWIPVWDCDLVYTESGVAEEGCVFQTTQDEGTDTWVISRFEPEERISFVRVDPRRTIRYDIYLEPSGDGTTLRWEQEITALNEAGDGHVAGVRREDFARQIDTVERMLAHYLETGEALDTEYHSKR